MIINKLIVKKLSGDIIRDVDFHTGLNLIVDNDLEGKGNNIGKTTLLRCIDYCLGGKGDDIYKDKETKGINTAVYEFLHDTELELYITNSSGIQFTLKRNFFKKRKEGLYEIDGVNVGSLVKYNERLKELFYRTEDDKPSFRSLLTKFIRLDDYRMSKILLFVNQNTTLDEYQLIHSFLFGFTNFDLLNTHALLRKEIALLTDQRKSIKSITEFHNDSALNQSIITYEENILELDDKINKLQIEKGNEELLLEIKTLRGQISNISLEISKLTTEISFHQKSKSKLEHELTLADENYIKAIYEQAKSYIPDIQKTYKEVMDFHNSIVVDRISLVQTSLKNLLDEMDVLQKEKSKLFEKEMKLLNLIGGDYNSDLDVLIEQRNNLLEGKSKLTNIQSMLKDISDKLEQKGKHLIAIEPAITEEMNNLEKNITTFNSFFRKYAKVVCDKDLFLSAGYSDQGILKYKIHNLPGNDGPGEKKSQIAAFDFAYTDFAIKTGMAGPKFVIHDNIEGKDNHHFTKVFLLANQFSGQYIVSVIKDRVSSFLSDEEIKNHAVVYLNSKDKFFKIN